MIGPELITTTLFDKKIVNFPLSLISTRDLNPRKGGLIKENIEQLMAADDFPEIHIGKLGEEYITVDGYHRGTVAKMKNMETIRAFVVEYKNLEDLKKAAFISNVNHGYKLNDMDIALNIYDFFIEKTKIDPTTSISSVIKEYQVAERTGRSLFDWSVISKEILGPGILAIEGKHRCTEYMKLVRHAGEKVGEVTEAFKDAFRSFFLKYDPMYNDSKPKTRQIGRDTLRTAIELYIKGGDYYEELEKQEAAVELMEQADATAAKDEVEKIDSEDSIDRTGNAAAASASGIEPNATMEGLAATSEEIKAEAAEVSEKAEAELYSVGPRINKIKADFNDIKFLFGKGKITFTQEEKLALNELVDEMCSLIQDIPVADVEKAFI
jgi:ParB-like chromosome segregation protein Spo0J